MLGNLNKRQKIEITITAIGIILLIFLITDTINKSKKKKIHIIETASMVTSSLTTPITFEPVEIKESAIKEGWGKDPFFFDLSNVRSLGLEGLILNGIAWDKEIPYAIINNNIVKIGDRVDDMTVVEISEKSVILEQGNQRYTLELNVAAPF